MCSDHQYNRTTSNISTHLDPSHSNTVDTSIHHSTHHIRSDHLIMSNSATISTDQYSSPAVSSSIHIDLHQPDHNINSINDRISTRYHCSSININSALDQINSALDQINHINYHILNQFTSYQNSIMHDQSSIILYSSSYTTQ